MKCPYDNSSYHFLKVHFILALEFIWLKVFYIMVYLKSLSFFNLKSKKSKKSEDQGTTTNEDLKEKKCYYEECTHPCKRRREIKLNIL